MNKPTPSENKCTQCGHEGLTVAIEVTEYQPAQLVDGEWSMGDVTDTMPGSCGPDDQQVRLFCAECGTYYEAPDFKG